MQINRSVRDSPINRAELFYYPYTDNYQQDRADSIFIVFLKFRTNCNMSINKAILTEPPCTTVRITDM